MEKKLTCNSCNVELNEPGWMKFKCPDCGKSDIYRCRHCRSLGARYECSSCEFTGPN